MRSMTMRFLGVVVILCLVATGASADDLRPPDWRGQLGTTLQDWDYLTGDNPVGPDGDYGDQNPYGEPLCTLSGPEDMEWSLESSSNRNGLWAAVLNADFYLPNDPEPDLEKWIRVQVMYRVVGPHTAPSSVTAAIGTDVFDGTLTETITLYGHGYGWKLDVWDIVGSPNPEFEYVDVNFPGEYGGILDHVVIDTICTPEPATVAFMGIGCLLACRRRR